MQRAYLPALLMILASSVCAAPPALNVPPPPPLSSEEGIEPEVTIKRGEDKTVEEYSINGQVYMIKVTPKKGPAYYLIDSDGDGTLESSPSEIEPRLLIPSWVLFRW